MFLVRLIYASKVSDMFLPGDIDNILATARHKNKKSGITGMLCFNSEYFLQCIEGTRSAVNKIFSEIQKDTRHDAIMLISYSEIFSRQFGVWDMGFISEQKLKKETIIKYSGNDIFDPYSIQGESALSMLIEFRDYLV